MTITIPLWLIYVVGAVICAGAIALGVFLLIGWLEWREISRGRWGWW